MAKVNFERVQARIPIPRRGYLSVQDYARCDLALPSAELRAIAGLMRTLAWIEEAVEHDGALFVKISYGTPWLVQERAFHTALGTARRLLAKAIDTLRNGDIPESVKPRHVEKHVSSHRGASTGVRGTTVGNVTHFDGGMYLMPDGHYGTGFAVHDSGDGLEGYFVTSDRYDHKAEILAAALLRSVLPEAGIGECQETSYHQMSIGRDVPRLADTAVACYNVASATIRTFGTEIGQLQWKGAPSVFLDEDNAARDMLVAEMRAGATIERRLLEDARYNDCDGVCEFTLSDGTPLPHYIVTRLQNAETILPLGHPFNHRKHGEPLVPLVYNPKVDQALLAPAERSVPFQAFQSYCSHRRYDNDHECAHRTGGGEYCSAGRCPITVQVYAEDVGRYGMDFREDPAFEDEDWEHDPMVRALHRNTERSYAWRAAGENAVMAVVNQVVHAKYALGVDRHLYGNENMRAVRQAVADGWLVVDQEMPGFGTVVRLSESTIVKVEEQRAARCGHADREAPHAS